MIKKIFFYFFCLFLISSCVKKRDLSTNTVVAHILSQPDGLHPYNNNSVMRSYIFAYTQKTLLGLDLASLDYVPDLIKELPTSSDDNKTFFFELREDIKWDNGEQVTGEDVVFSAKIMLCHLTNNSQIRPIYNSVIKSVKLNPTNPLKFSMTAQDINWTAKTILGGIYIQQKSYWDPNGLFDNISFEQILDRSFKETDETGAGSLWRMPLDGKELRFDASQDGTTFTGYKDILRLGADGKIVAPNLLKENITSAKSLVTKEYVDNNPEVAALGLSLASMAYSMSRVSPSGSYTAVERYSYPNVTYTSAMGARYGSTSAGSWRWTRGAIASDGYLFTGSSNKLYHINSNKEWFARAANLHPTLDLKIKVNFQFISNTDDQADHILWYRLKTTNNPLDSNPGTGALVTVEERRNAAGDSGSQYAPHTWGVYRTVTNREIIVPAGQTIFFKFFGRINYGSGQNEGIGIRGFNIHSPTWG